MIIYPAIDLIDGKCVRLEKGDFDSKKEYSANPSEVLNGYHAAGAQWTHIVDLDAAKDSHNRQLSVIKGLCALNGLSIQSGGGVRSAADVEELLNAGIDRVVIGSMAVKEKEATKKIIEHFGVDKICLAMDVQENDGQYYVAIHGWQEGSSEELFSLIDEYKELGLKHVLCTDISKDGMLTGCNFDLYAQLTEAYPDIKFQASGGVHALEDITQLNCDGVIIGKALYENKFTINEALEAATSC